MIPDVRPFILQNTRLQSPALLPELRLHLADDVMPIWECLQEVAADPEVPPPFWAFAWAGGIAAARYILDHAHESKGKRVIDVGSGSGVVAIAAALAGAESTRASETDPLAREALALNAAENTVAIQVLDGDLLAGPMPACDVIVAGDMFYERALAERALRWLRSAHEARVRVLVGDPARPHFPHAQMRLLAGYEIPVLPGLEDRPIKTAGVYTFMDANL